MAERKMATPSPANALADAAMMTPIPIVQAAGAVTKGLLAVNQAMDQAYLDDAYDMAVRGEDEQATAAKSAEFEQQLIENKDTQNQGSVFAADGGKITPDQYLERLGIGGRPSVPVQPALEEKPPADINQVGFSSNTLHNVNASASPLDVAMQQAPKVAGQIQQFNKEAQEKALRAAKIAATGGTSEIANAGGGGEIDINSVQKERENIYKDTPGSGLNATGGKIVGKGDGSGTDDAIATKLDDGFVIPKDQVERAKSDGVMSAVGHNEGTVANVKKTNAGNAEAMVSDGEYYFNEAETQALTSKGVNLDNYAPNSNTKMNPIGRAEGGFLDGLKNLISGQNDMGWKNRVFNEYVKDYRGDVDEGVTFDPEDQESIPSIRDWWDKIDPRSNPSSGGGDAIAFTKAAFQGSGAQGVDLQTVSGEYDRWMEQNRPEHFKKFNADNSEDKKEGDKKSTGTTTSTGNEDVDDFNAWNKKYNNLYDVMTAANTAVDLGVLGHNIEQTFKGKEAPQISKGNYPIPNMTGMKNELDRNIGKVNTLNSVNKTADLASNMNLYAGLKASGLDMTRQATSEYIDKIDTAKKEKFAYEKEIEKANSEMDMKQDQLNMYLGNEFNKQKGAAIQQGVDAIQDNVQANMDTKLAGKQTEILLEQALKNKNAFMAGGQYFPLMQKYGDDFPANWIGEEGQAFFIENFNQPVIQEKIKELDMMLINRQKEEDAKKAADLTKLDAGSNNDNETE